MDEAWKWLVENKQWVFDGFGVVIVVGIVGWFTKRFSRDSATQSQNVSGGSTAIQSGRDSNVGNAKAKGKEK